MGPGWYSLSEYGVWSTNKAQIIISLDDESKNQKEYELRIWFKMLAASILSPNRVKVTMNNKFLVNWAIKSEETNQRILIIKKESIENNEIVIDFDIPNATSPSSLGINDDDRNLGILLQAIELKSQM